MTTARTPPPGSRGDRANPRRKGAVHLRSHRRYLFGPHSGTDEPREDHHDGGFDDLWDHAHQRDGRARRDLHYLFKSFPADKTRQDVTARATKELLPDAEFQVLYIPNDVIGQTISETWLDGFNQVGEADALLYPSGTTDFAPFLTTTKATNPDVIHFWHTPPEEITALEQAIELDAAPTYLLHAVDPETYVERFPDLNVPVLLLCIPLCAGVTSSDTAASFFDRYRAFLDADLPIAAGVALLIYDYVFMLTAAMEEAGTVTDTDAIVAALEDLTYEGVLGTLKFDERHIVEHGFDICTTVGTIECEFYPPLG